MADDLGLQGCRAAVIGGDGPLGTVCCHRLAGGGSSVAVLDRDRAAALTLAEQLRTRWKRDAVGYAVEGSDWDATARVVGALAERWGGLDVVVNELVSAAADCTSGTFADEDPAVIAAAVERSLGLVVSVTRAMLDVMIPARRGRIINVVAGSGLHGLPGRVADDAGHAAVIGLTRNLAHELPDHGITVTAVAVETIADPERVADTVAFLASSAGSGVDGSVVSVGGARPA